MPTAFKFSVQPGIDDEDRLIFADHPLTEGDNVRIVVLFGEPGAFLVPANSATDSPYFVGYDGLAISAASQNNPQVCFPGRHAFGCRTDKIRIIDRRFTVRPKIDNLISRGSQVRRNNYLIAKSRMVRCNGNLHPDTIIVNITDLASENTWAEPHRPAVGLHHRRGVSHSDQAEASTH